VRVSAAYAERVFIGIEVFVALDRKSERTACFAKFVHADEANLWRAHSEIAEL